MSYLNLADGIRGEEQGAGVPESRQPIFEDVENVAADYMNAFIFAIKIPLYSIE